jgi:Mg-chelatase subunit ChlD
MNGTRSTMALVLILAALLVLACGPAAEPTPTPEPPAAAPTQPVAQSPCGDGVCDEVELKNPDLCPQDCPPTEPPPTEPAPTEPPATEPPPTEPPSAEAPTDTPQPEPTEIADRCGDGVCDEVEAKDPELCPEDCETPTPEVAITVEVTEAPTAAPTGTPVPEIEGQATTTTVGGEVAFIGDPATIEQEGASQAEQPQSNVALILDGSGSMGEALPGSGQTKLAVAKEVMAEVIPQIPAELNGALWIYAHRFPPEPKAESCTDIEEVFPLGPVDAAAYVETIQGIQANGWTPIADSIIAAAESLPPGDFNSVILVSDGEETCGGDPCAVAEALKAGDVELTVHVVGYAVDDATREQLECIASVSGGSYHDATDADGLLLALQEALDAAIVETVLRVELVVPDGTEEHAYVHLYEAGTGRLVSDYATWKDNLVPPGVYDLEVDTLPKVVYEGLTLPEGSTTVVRIVLSAIEVVTTDEGEDTMVDILDAGGERLTFGYVATFVLVPSTYRVGLRGMVSGPIVLEPGELYELRMGAIRVLTPEGREDTFVTILDDTGRELDHAYGGLFELVPATYHVVAYSSVSEPITIGPGELYELQLGAIHVLDADGNEDTHVYLLDAQGEEMDHGTGGTFPLVPGTYHARVFSSVSEPIVLGPGEQYELQLGAVHVLTPEGGEDAMVYFEDTDGQRLDFGRGGTFKLVPGTYHLKVNDTRSDPVVVGSGETVEFRLGEIVVAGSFELLDAGGDRLGLTRRDSDWVVPGTYTVKLEDGTLIEGVVVQPGQVVEVD